ncbi:microsomal triglyceride transfer protein large subunit [Copidosoma floridanum]|uniref:microsomal triglyceride transfer protein large subunit n=1 Tax=Copidosoma floridanum TaxID=29053 RepID=UPI0006C96D5D|nr:microsomal triglyceride transfer protein large subunit [Copidosoma floridanum]XP_014212366.1 microsomal triglyceride transfer protein large subunit [Copidosoma floridanum]
MTIAATRLITFLVILKIISAQNWNLGNGLIYDMTTSILLGETSQSVHDSKDDVGFQVTAKVRVSPIWKDPTDPETTLISIKTDSLQLWIKSRKAPKPEGFVKHTSRLEDAPKEPIFLLWKKGQIKTIFANSDESISSLNLKRGIASIFQYKTVDSVFQERDASGLCNVTYKFVRPKVLNKIKEFCKSTKHQHSNPILGVRVSNLNSITYELTETLIPKHVIEEEKHEMHLVAKLDARSSVTTHRTFRLLPETFVGETVVASTYPEVFNKFNSRFVDISIETQNEHTPCPESGCLTLEAALENYSKALESANLGTAKSASAFLKIVPLIREASAENLAKILKSPRNHDILPQLYDLYGSASTLAAHQAAMKILRQDELGDNTERYLWALSTSAYPDASIIKDVLKRSEEVIQNDKLSETYALTAAAMAKRHGGLSVIELVKDSLELGLHTCTGEQCKMKFLRSLGNLGSKGVVPILLRHTNSSKSLSVIAWKAISSLCASLITGDVKKLAMKTFFQLNGQKIDSTVRTLTLNVILENDPSVDELHALLLYLTKRDKVYEVQKYLVQRIQQLASTDVQFNEKLEAALKRDFYKLFNYNTYAQRGLSTAFTRDFVRSAGSNGSLVTIQEINSGLLKRGVVDIVLESGSHKYTFFSLGLFAGGLNSFVSSNEPEDNEIPTDNEPATAGMELSVLDVDIRPFVFFSGQGELMGHVWSGTASERTAAFQTIVNLHRHREVIFLGSGFVVEIGVEGAISIDLAGHVQLSLWSRNAQSIVELGAGIAIQGSSKILTNFVQSRAEFTLNLEPKLELATDVDFSGPVSLCMRLAQPQTTLKHLVYKVERIPGSRHRLRKTRRMQSLSPARSYLLNSKNNEMCAKIFS